MKPPLRYRYIRLWYRRRRPVLVRAGGFALCHIAAGVVVTAVGGRLVGVNRYEV